MTAGEPSPEQVAALLAERLAIAGEWLRTRRAPPSPVTACMGPLSAHA